LGVFSASVHGRTSWEVNDMAKRHEQPKQKRKRIRAMPSPYAYAFTIEDAQRMGAPGKTAIYQLLREGRLQRAPDACGRTMITGQSLRALLGVEEDAVALVTNGTITA
jgi:hypothetical protein